MSEWSGFWTFMASQWAKCTSFQMSWVMFALVPHALPNGVIRMGIWHSWNVLQTPNKHRTFIGYLIPPPPRHHEIFVEIIQRDTHVASARTIYVISMLLIISMCKKVWINQHRFYVLGLLRFNYGGETNVYHHVYIWGQNFCSLSTFYIIAHIHCVCHVGCILCPGVGYRYCVALKHVSCAFIHGGNRTY